MASVLSSQVIRDDAQANGWRYLEYRYVIEDNALNQVTLDVGPLYVPAAFDDATDVVARGDEVLDSLRDQEVEGVFNQAKLAEDEIENLAAHQAQIWSTVDSPTYTITKRLQKRLIYYLMRKGDAQFALNVKTVYDNLPATDLAIRNRLDITQVQLDRLRTKVAEFYDVPSIAKSGTDIIIGDFTTQSEDWGEP